MTRLPGWLLTALLVAGVSLLGFLLVCAYTMLFPASSFPTVTLHLLSSALL